MAAERVGAHIIHRDYDLDLPEAAKKEKQLFPPPLLEVAEKSPMDGGASGARILASSKPPD
jgi:hypothetical protein